MTDYVVQYSLATGYLIGMWLKETTDNIATAIADGELTVDGADVVIGWPDETSDIAFAVLTDPEIVLTTLEPAVAMVEIVEEVATDVVERTDAGRNPEYEYDNPIEE